MTVQPIIRYGPCFHSEPIPAGNQHSAVLRALACRCSAAFLHSASGEFKRQIACCACFDEDRSFHFFWTDGLQGPSSFAMACATLGLGESVDFWERLFMYSIQLFEALF